MPIFSSVFLNSYLRDFDANKVVDFVNKKEILRSWILSLESGKIDAEKEVSIKSTFVNDFFGKVLGYAYSNADYWLLQQEQKSFVDGSMCDVAFGYFSIVDEQIKGEVRMVAEFKNSTSNLDSAQQNRLVKISAVDQAFLYAAKMSGNCNWVVVCNVREIRFYHYSSQVCFQSYLLQDLLEDDDLLEMLFLFQAESLLSREGSSRTDKLYELSIKKDIVPITQSLHVLDEMFLLLKKFDGLGFVDPVYVAGLYPFNFLGQRVWHYTNGVLHTTNPEVFKLLQGLNVQDGEVIIMPELKSEFVQKNVLEPLNKLQFIFERLNHWMIFHITAVEDLQEVRRRKREIIGFSLNHSTGYSDDYGISLSIDVLKDAQCDCVTCLYRKLDFKGIIKRLKNYHSEEKDLEYAFGNYLLRSSNDNQLYYDLEVLEKRYKSMDSHISEYMIVKMNLKNNILQVDCSSVKGKAIKSRLEQMDLDGVIAYEVDLFAPIELRRYLVQIKDSVLIDRIKFEAAHSKNQTKHIMEVNLRGDVIHAFDQVKALHIQRWMLYRYSQANYLMLEHQSKTRLIHQDIFKGYIYSYLTPGVGLEEFDEHMLTDAILYIHPSKLNEILKDITELKVSNKTRNAMLAKATNLLASHISSVGIHGLYEDTDMKVLMLNFESKMAHYEVFSSLFILVAKLDCSTEDIRSIAKDIIKFLKVDPNYDDQYMGSLSLLIEKFGNAFSCNAFLEILEIIIPKLKIHNHRHDEIFNGICKSWRQHFPLDRINNIKLIHQASVNHMNGSNPDYMRLANLWHITEPELQGIIIAEFERYLDSKFDGWLFQNLVHDLVLSYDHKDYFDLYVKAQIVHNTPDGYFYSEGKQMMNPAIYNLAIVVHRFNIPLDHPALLSMTGITPFQCFLLNPDDFNYSFFEVLWLKNISSSYILNKLKGNKEVMSAVLESLKENFDDNMAEMYFKYIANFAD